MKDTSGTVHFPEVSFAITRVFATEFINDEYGGDFEIQRRGES